MAYDNLKLFLVAFSRKREEFFSFRSSKASFCDLEGLNNGEVRVVNVANLAFDQLSNFWTA